MQGDGSGETMGRFLKKKKMFLIMMQQQEIKVIKSEMLSALNRLRSASY